MHLGKTLKIVLNNSPNYIIANMPGKLHYFDTIEMGEDLTTTRLQQDKTFGERLGLVVAV